MTNNAIAGHKNPTGLVHRAVAHVQNRPQAASYQEVVKTEILLDIVKRVHGFYGYTLEEAIELLESKGYDINK